MFDRGYWHFATVRGVPLRVHWSLPVGMLLMAGFSPVSWLAFLVIVLGHEAGHALLVRRYGFHVHAIDVHGFGGLTRWVGHATPHERSVIAWGGVAAQGLLLVTTLALVIVFGWPTSWAGYALARAFIYTNLFIMALNLLPFPPFDGAEAWRLARGWRDRLGGGPRGRFGGR